MPDSIISEIDKLKIIYKEIIDGCSFSEENNVYIKHLNELENSEVIRKKNAIFLKYIKNGLPSQEEKLKSLIESEQWSPAQEEEILNYQYLISDNEKNLKKIIPQQHGPILRVIEDTKKKLSIMESEKRELVGRTANDFAERDGFNYFIYLSLYRDRECKIRLFNQFEDFDKMEEESISPHIKILEEKLSSISEQNVRKISVLPFFINSFSYAKEAMHTFLNKPLVEMTPYQVLLFSLGSRNLNILSQIDGEPPSLLNDTKIDDIVLFYDQQYSILSSRKKTPR